ncbi:LIP-domain-containing protein [Athelia psychrophila]|uniref:triacylglycerol lipase n=1 Tax=Athelia psychrophila TaxID=1759441 RepID=A0A167VMC9_9AGAM|nr:LIP-domain-containing protein [Fibularhizoctonia sp. CBS 109695]
MRRGSLIEYLPNTLKMLRINSLFIALLGIAQVTLGAAVLTPDNDPFYQPPAGFASSAPGTVFKNRTAPSGIAGINAVQILYRTSYINNTATATVATILTNSSATRDKLVAYDDYEDSANTACAPSYLFNTNNGNAEFGPLGVEVTNGLANGWTLVIADYEGINSAFGSGRQEGYAILDGLRAALSYAPAGISQNATIGGYGYSGGAIATGWAASLQPTYAPELNVVGWAIGGTPANVTSTMQNVEGTTFAGFAAAGIAGTISGYPAVGARFNEIATPIGQAAIAKARSQCATSDLVTFLLEDFETTVYQNLGDQLLYDPTIAAALANGTMGINADETPKAPVYMYHGKSDEVIPYDSALKAANAWCAFGASVEFVTGTGGTGHLGTEAALISNATSWLDLRLSGIPPATGCSNASWPALGNPLKRDGASTSSIERFGVGDEKVIADILERHEEGREIPGLWSYLRIF